MRRKLLTVLTCLLVAVSLVSCVSVNAPKDADIDLSVNKADKLAEKSLSISTVETEKTVDLTKSEKTEAIKDENSFEKTETGETDITDEVSCDGEKEKVKNYVFKCTLSVKCDTVLKNITELKKEKIEILPKNGIIFPETEVIFYEGESVFNVLKRELKKNKIHIDFVNAPLYNTVYIRGISNLYEHDCGELSGWIYRVNGKVPSIGCSQYMLNNGDKIEFVYTCNLGKDIN